MASTEFRILRLKRLHCAIMLKHTTDTLPSEACGILLGRAVEDIALVLDAVPTRNVSSSKDLFAVDPEELYQVLLHGESQGLEVVGIYHSHLVDSYPSDIDRIYMKLNSVVWLIFGFSSSGAMRVSAHQMVGDVLREVVVEVL